MSTPLTTREAELVAERETPAQAPTRLVVVKPAPRWPHLDISEFWHYRELFAMLVWRDIKVRYKQTFIGATWAILQPVALMIVFSLVLGKFARVGAEGLPYQLFSYSGLLPWTYFASALALSSASVVANANLVTKVYFPRVFLPFAASAVPAVDFALASTVLVGLMVWYSHPLSITIVLVPAFLALAFLTALGVGLFLSAVNVRYRDVPYAVPFVVQTWMWVSPVVYSFRALPDRWQWVLSFNPMTGVINGFRWALLGTPAPSLGQLTLSVTASVAFFLIGLGYFRRSEPRFADTI